MYIDHELYKAIVDCSVVATVDIIFIDSAKRVLLWLRNNAPLKWAYYLPWGRINKNESIVDAAKRKAQQELGLVLDISKLRFVWVYDDIFLDSAFDWISAHCLPCTFVYSLSQNDIDAIAFDSQHSDFHFFEYTDDLLHPFLKNRLSLIESIYHVFM
jgi:colanic acid biosynthesis protein WcaH